MSMGRQEILGTLSAAWVRQVSEWGEETDVGPICVVYADEALTGWALIIESPVIEEFRDEKCIVLPLTTWIRLKTLSSETVTPFRIVAKGKNLVFGAWRPHTGLKYAVRATKSWNTAIHIPVSDLQEVGK